MEPTRSTRAGHTPPPTRKAAHRPEPKADVTARAVPVALAESRDAMIRQAAYSLYVQRGATYGHAIEDWLQAEALVDQALAAD